MMMRGYTWNNGWESSWVGWDEEACGYKESDHPKLAQPKWKVGDRLEVRWSFGTCVGVVTEITGVTEAKRYFRPQGEARITYDVRWTGHGHWVWENNVVGIWTGKT